MGDDVAKSCELVMLNNSMGVEDKNHFGWSFIEQWQLSNLEE